MKKQTKINETKYVIWNEARGEFADDIFFDKESIENYLKAEYDPAETYELNDLEIYELKPSNLKVSTMIHIEEE